MDWQRPRFKVRGGSEHQNWILSGTEAPAGKEREVTATGADAGSSQPEQGGLPAALASVGLRGAREPGGSLGTPLESPFIFRIVFCIIVLIQAQRPP